MPPSAGATPGPGPAAAQTAAARSAVAHMTVTHMTVAHMTVTKVMADLDAVRQALLSPELTRIDDCLPRLEQAAAEFLALRDGWREVPSQAPDHVRLRRDLRTVRQDLARLAGLAHSGARFYSGLARLLGAAGGGYTPRGEAAPLRPRASILVRG